MLESGADLDPEEATTAAEFLARLRLVRTAAGLSLRQLERQGREMGVHLAPSTVATMLGRTTLPRPELVEAYLLACGVPAEDIERWLAVRQRLVLEAESEGAGAGPEVEPVASAAPPAAAPAPGRRLAVVAVAVAALGAAGGIGWLLGRSSVEVDSSAESSGADVVANPAPRAGLPPEGPYQVRVQHSRLCLSERPGTDGGQIYQADCADAFPAVSLDPLGDDLYRIRTDHPEFGPGCMGIESIAPDEAFGTVADDFCETGSVEDFRLEPVAGPSGRSFRIRPAHSDRCLGVPDDSTEPWAPVRELACDEDRPGQLFAFEPRD